MIDLTEKTISSEQIYQGQIINLKVDQVQLPNGNNSTREIVEHSGGVTVIPYQAGKVTLVEQFRKPAEKVLLELPAGKLEAGEDLELCALRELKEETGYQANSLQKLTSFYSSPGFTDEMIHLFLATDLKQYEQQPDPEEFIELRQIKVEQVAKMLAEGEFEDAKTIIGLQYLVNKVDQN
ncbi:NUDIX hydrolase [Natroniella sulfidigena]|uniref:NUDIX hydrolase n=1 Tax=Natroniella sulfidigena TaxID=723921 RepID=UPI00200AB1E7|nr:NUDIX hydrolase [Natroniella sulfidigena]MCK8816605.1 NUDIX hydrolase [Natroniella sulfidigena]